MAPKDREMPPQPGAAKSYEEYADEFFDGPALSFERQPLLEDLFQTLARTEKPITLVLGAGVSLDAGLPSWQDLIDNMISLIPEDRWRDPVSADEADATRKAEYVIQMVKEATNRTDEETVRDALYLNNKAVSPGHLADAAARLASALNGRVNVITTNYDKLFEDALQNYVDESPRALSLDAYELDPGYLDTSTKVIHVHGVAAPNEDPQKPLILSESSFLREGPRVREAITERIKNSCVVFIGVSLTDSNLVGPLWDLKLSNTSYQRPYLFLVAVPSDKAQNAEDSKAYVVKRAKFLETELGVGTIFLKSYSQLAQVLYEAVLAMREPERYLENQLSEQSLRYGHRLTSALNECYRAVGCQDGADLPLQRDAEALGEQLYNLFFGEDGLNTYLTRLKNAMSRSNNWRVHEAFKKFSDDLSSEHFGLFMWLRSRGNEGTDNEYTLKLIGSSVYMHREPWSLDRVAAVEPNSRHAAARAVFFGTSQWEDVVDSRDWQLWRSIIAVPFSLDGHRYEETLGKDKKYVDTLTIGAMTLNSTHHAIEPEGGHWTGSRSVLSFITVPQVMYIESRLAEFGRRILSNPTTQS